MDSHDRYDRLLAAFLAGDLGPVEALAWDEHLLECEACWRAVREDRAGRQAAQLLRQPAPPRLADKVAFAVEVAAAGRTAGRRQARPGAGAWWQAGPGRRLARAGGWAGHGWRARGRWRPRSSCLSCKAGAEAGACPPRWRRSRVTRRRSRCQPRISILIPAGRRRRCRWGPPGDGDRGGQKIVLTTWRLGGTEAVAAVSGQPFPMPAGAQGLSGRGKAWSARLGRLSLYCLNGLTSELVAAPVPAAELAALAARLPPA